MNINYKDGKLQIDLHDLLDNVREEDLNEFLETVSCNDKVIKHVTDQILDRWTENCYSGGTACTADADGAEPHPRGAARRVPRKTADTRVT